MKLFLGVLGWGVAVIVGCTGFAVVRHEVGLRDAEIATLRAEGEVLRGNLAKLSLAFDERGQSTLAAVEKLRRLDELEREGDEIEQRSSERRARLATMTDLDEKQAELFRGIEDTKRLEQIIAEIRHIGK